jgi:hypothetical protein
MIVRKGDVSLGVFLGRLRRVASTAGAPYVASMEIEFDGRLFIAGSGEVCITLARPRFAWLSRKALHRFKVCFEAGDSWKPSLYRDGEAVLFRGTQIPL